MPIISNQKIELVPAGLSLASGRLDNAQLRGTGGTALVGNSYQTISATPGIVAQPSLSGEYLKVVSTDGADTNNGGATGARKVKIKGLDENGIEVEENLPLNGTTPVTTQFQYTSVNQFFATQMGGNNTTDANVGDIKILTNDETGEVGRVAAGVNRMYSAQWSSPSDKTTYITSFVYGVAGTSPAEISMWGRNQVGQPFQRLLAVVAENGTNTYKLYNPFMLRIGGIIQFRAKALDAGQTAHVSVDFQLIQES